MSKKVVTKAIEKKQREVKGVENKDQKGSKYQLKTYLKENPVELTEQLLSSSPSLLSFIDENLQMQWKSPFGDINKEYSNGFLELEEDWSGKRKELEKYWPKQGPQWDGVAIVEGINGEKGLVLVEAKAHVHEMKSKIRAEEPSRSMIIKTIEETKEVMGSEASLDVWLDHYYQLSNRLAFLYLLNEKLGIKTWLALINFVDDTTHRPTPFEGWMKYYQQVFTKMDINKVPAELISIYPQSFKG